MNMVPAFRRSFRVALFLGTLVAAVASSQAVLITDAKADSAEKVKVAVGGFDGNKSGDARSAFIDALKKDGGYEVTDAEDVKPSAKAKSIAETAKGLAVNFVITGKVGKGSLKLKVLKGSDGKLIDEVELKGAGDKLKGNIEKSGASSVAPALGVKAKEEPKAEEVKPAEEDKPEEEAKPAEEVSVSTKDTGDKGDLTPLALTAGLKPLHRTFTFHDTLADLRPADGYIQLLKYELPLGPVLFIDLDFFPGSLLMKGPAEWIGLTGGFEKGFATQSVYREGQSDEKTLKTDIQAFYVGAKFRFPIGAHTIGATGTYGQHKFTLLGDEDPVIGADGVARAYPMIPDVRYDYAKIGIDSMFHFGDFMAGARVGKRFVFKTGALETQWFQNSVKTSSLEAGVTVGYRLVSMLDLVVGFDWLRYAFDFNPVEKRPSYVAGGAVDEYMSGHIAFRFHLPGGAEAAATTE
mgnify:CR=1 FL=1